MAYRKINWHRGYVVEIDAHAVGLYPGKNAPELPQGKDPLEANVFANPFSKISGQYPCNFCAEGWIYWSQGHWWHPLVGHILGVCRSLLKRAGFYEAVRGVQVGFRQSYGNFFGIFDFYNQDSETFFTPIGELGVAYYEMYYVSSLPYGKFPYMKHFLTNGKLEQWKQMLEALETYWEVLCHFHICMDLCDRRKGGLSFTKLAKYLVSLLKSPKILSPVSLA